MEGNAIAKNSKNLPRTPHTGLITLAICFTLLVLLTASLLRLKFTNSGDTSAVHHHHHHRHHHNLLKTACTHSPNPPSCVSSLSTTLPPSSTALSLRHLLAAAINHSIALATHAHSKIATSSSNPLRNLTKHENTALRDCLVLIDQTLYELGKASAALRLSGDSDPPYGDLKTLLSAAMTNDNTCIDGFSDLEHSKSSPNAVRERLQIELAPISHMISNCLAIIKYIETSIAEPKRPRFEFRPWMSHRERRMMGPGYRNDQYHIVVAKDGTGDCRSISEAIRRAPSYSKTRFLIKIKAGTYHENVEVPRNKTNVMLVGDGMQYTVITSSRNFLDGFSTFTSATLTVYGDKFLARDITILNRSGREKHQAVALRATSTSAFYRCNISSYQDTLYVHSLRQFYRECVIEGTIDFIFGNAAAVFQNCLILVRKPIRGQRNMITAQGREDPNQNTGISMQNCTIARASEFRMEDSRIFWTFLGRPWRNHSRTIIMNSYIGDLVHPQGWSRWNEYSNLDTVEYIEYGNFGPGSDTRGRVRWKGYKKKYSVHKARKFSVRSFLHGSDEWLETTGFPFFHGP